MLYFQKEVNLLDNRKFKNTTKKTYDIFLTVCITACLVISFLAITSATRSSDPLRFLIIQGAAVLIGVFIIFISLRFDYEFFGRFSLYIFLFNIAMLILVLIIGIGDNVGTRGWIRFGSIGIQPAEVVKIGFILSFSKHIASMGDELNKPKNMLKLLIHLAIIVGLIMLQPDYGTAMVFITIAIVMLFVANISWKYIAGAVGAFAVCAPLVWFFVLADYQKNRFIAFFKPESDPLGMGYHVSQSKLAIGSGRVLGNGLFGGVQTQMGYLPEKQTDFVFAVIGEELGFWGTMLVLLLLLCIIVRCFNTARNSRDLYGELIAAGVGAMFLFHTVENIGMCLGLMPVTGIPLPFISYGGSNMLTSMLGIALVMNVRRWKKQF